MAANAASMVAAEAEAVRSAARSAAARAAAKGATARRLRSASETAAAEAAAVGLAAAHAAAELAASSGAVRFALTKHGTAPWRGRYPRTLELAPTGVRTLDPMQEDLETNAWRWDQVLGASRGAAGERRLELHLGDGLCQSARSTLTFDAASDADCTKLLLHVADARANAADGGVQFDRGAADARRWLMWPET